MNVYNGHEHESMKNQDGEESFFQLLFSVIVNKWFVPYKLVYPPTWCKAI